MLVSSDELVLSLLIVDVGSLLNVVLVGVNIVY